MFKIGFIYPAWENLGIEYLSACLKQEGFETRLFLDPVLFKESGFLNFKLLGRTFSFKKQILKNIIGYRPDLLCFSVITDNYKWACEWASEIRKQVSVPVVFGGIHPTSVPEKVITNPLVDYVCIGEGEEAIVELAQALKNNKSVEHIKNICFKQNGKAVFNEIRPLISNLDFLPFPDKELFYSSAPIFKDGYAILSSRGCIFSCSYCNNNVLKKIYKTDNIFRRRSIENIIEELRYAKEKYKPEFVSFIDDFFNTDEAWLENFLNRYRNEINLPFNCYLFPDFVRENMILEMKKAGCYRVQLGVQIIDEHKRFRVLKRQSSNHEIGHVIDLFKRSRIYVVCDNILGFPGEEKKDLVNLAYFYNEHLPDHIEIFWLRYFPKCEIISWAIENGYISQEQNNDIEEGYLNCGITAGGDHQSSLARKFMIIFYIFPFLPKRLRKYLLDNMLYRFLLCFPSSAILYMLIRFFRFPRFDLNVARTKKRYHYFMLQKFSLSGRERKQQNRCLQIGLIKNF
jgi:anaerobic magnesium-protoporphyrin IX monomethyl ester cyclase